MFGSHVVVEPEPVARFAEQDSAAEETGESVQWGRHFIWKLSEETSPSPQHWTLAIDGLNRITYKSNKGNVDEMIKSF